MKNITLLLAGLTVILLSCNSEYPTIDDNSFYTQDGNGNLVEVGFLAEGKYNLDVDQKTRSTMIDIVMSESKDKLKFPLTFIPVDLKFGWDKSENEYRFILVSKGKNGFGVDIEFTSLINFTKNGKLIDSF
jgi:hypothetical protein